MVVVVITVNKENVILNNVRANRLADVVICTLRVLVSLGVMAFIFIVVVVTRTSASHVMRILSRIPRVRSGTSTMGGITSNSVSFGRMSFDCTKRKKGLSLGSMGLRVGSNRAMNVVNKAKDTGSALIRLVPELCSIAGNGIRIKNISMHGCGLRMLHSRISVMLRGGILFSKDVCSGVH